METLYPPELWPDEPAGWAFICRAVDALGRATYGESWTDNPPSEQVRAVEREIVKLIESTALECRALLPDGRLEKTRLEIWRGGIERWGRWMICGELSIPNPFGDTLRLPLFVPAASVERFAAPTAEIDEVWRPKERESLKAWCGRSEVVNAAVELIKAAGDANPARMDVARQLSAMWKRAGRSGGTAGTIEQYLMASGLYG